MAEDEKQRLVENIAATMQTVPELIQRKMLEHFAKADADYGQRIKNLLGLN